MCPKFHNRVFLVEKDVHMQRFLWRDLELENEPKTYIVTVNNFGVKPANCIATLALHKSADIFSEKYPQESEDLKFQTYIDDELVAASNREETVEKTRRMDEICEHAGMQNKGWTYSGDHRNSDVVIGGEIDVLEERVLGLSWVPGKDDFKFSVSVNLAEGGKRRNTGPKYSTLKEFEENLPRILTRRMLLSEVSKIFDPMGFLIPVLLESKLLIRETRCSDTTLGWDDPLPNHQVGRWHYQLSPAFIDKFDRDIESLINMYKHYGVDFQIRSDDKRVHNIVTKKEVTTEAETHIISVEERGQIELEGYVMNRLGEKAKESVWSPIKGLNLKMFSTPLKTSKNKSQVESLKENHALFARCAILLNSNRGMDMEEVISNYELGYPRSLISL